MTCHKNLKVSTTVALRQLSIDNNFKKNRYPAFLLRCPTASIRKSHAQQQDGKETRKCP